MDMTPILGFLIIYINCVTGLGVLKPDEVEVNILDGEAKVHWKHPADAPSNSQYNVQMAKYTGNWSIVTSCTKIKNTYCDLSGLTPDYDTAYKVRVQLVTGDYVSAWIRKKFLLNTSKLQPPSFTLWATSSTLKVYVHQKPILKKLFPFGLIYTFYLEETGQDTKNTTAYLKDDSIEEDQRTKTFSSLHWGKEYCVSIKVESNGALSASSVSPKQCVRLPEQEWYTIVVTALSILSVVAVATIIAALLLYYLRGPEKTPAVLKSPVSGWLPVSVGEATMEVVTDKGWFLSSDETETKNSVKHPVANVTITEENGEGEDRRTSMDSGVSMVSNSANDSRESSPRRQEDSGCGSLGGPESSTSSQTDYPMQEERTDTDMTRKREDSGVGLGCQIHSSSMNLDGQDSGTLKDAVAWGNYRRQSPTAVHSHVCDNEEAFKLMLPDSILAEVVTGYRAGPQSCICSGAGQCTWCHKQGLYGTGVIKQYRALCVDNGLLSNKCDFVDSYKGITFSSCSKKTQMNTVTMDDFDTTFTEFRETLPLLTAIAPLSLMEGQRDFNMNNVSLSLCDVQLTSD
uniref:interleukin-10 receptor subunit alpha n=1 Tax=Scatophagus argus TaxID=75038 RepID=UPI001ED81387|nr:interleukin-10 receptor subunit alpha [Scatophagus argus]